MPQRALVVRVGRVQHTSLFDDPWDPAKPCPAISLLSVLTVANTVLVEIG